MTKKSRFDLTGGPQNEEFRASKTNPINEALRQRPLAVELRRFDRFLRLDVGLSLPKVAIAGFDGGSYQVSSRIITESEFKAALAKTRDGSVVFVNDLQALETRVFLILGYRLGMRRGEILGLQAGDTRWGLRSILHVRPNEKRTLKTSNALRALAVDALSTFEKAQLRSLCESKSSPDYLFFDHAPSTKELESAAVVRRVNDILYRVTGDPHLHPHNLRHSFPTQLALGMFGKDIGLATHPYAELWMRRTIQAGERFEHDVCGSLHRKGGRGSAIAVAMGHGSETTSYEHYVHSLDLLLFFACAQFLQPETFGVGSVRDRFRVGEVELLTAILGLDPTTRLSTDDIPNLVAGVAKHCPGRMQLAELRRAHSPQKGKLPDAYPLISLADLKSLPGAEEMVGYPHRMEGSGRRSTVATKSLRREGRLDSHQLDAIVGDICDRRSGEFVADGGHVAEDSRLCLPGRRGGRDYPHSRGDFDSIGRGGIC